LQGDAVGDVMLYGRGAGALPTASAVVSDVIYAATHSEIKYSTFNNTEDSEPGMKFISDFKSMYYLRLSVEDEVGVLEKMCGYFARYGVSIVQVGQKGWEVEKRKGQKPRIPLYIVTHQTSENKIMSAVAKINASELATVESLIRIEK
jgi:homoserine dehydrogenase